MGTTEGAHIPQVVTVEDILRLSNDPLREGGFVVGDVGFIPTTIGPYVAVDLDDYDRSIELEWSFVKTDAQPYGYAYRRTDGVNIYLHKWLIGVDKGWAAVDHINGVSIDNRLANLRVCTLSQNQHNRMKNRNSSSRYKGVVYNRRDSKWFARITLNHETRHIGTFRNEEDAARAYDDAAREMFGEFCRLNFPREGERSCLTLDS